MGTAGISSDDPDAIDKLREKLESLEGSQSAMKSTNAYYRKHKTLDGCPDLSEDAKHKIESRMNDTRFGRQTQPYPAWALSNNSAEIRRIKKRIEDMGRMAGSADEGWEFEGGSVVINKEINRLQILFDEKPDDDLRSELKSNGFKWARSQGAWQRQYTDNAMYAVKRIKAIAPAE